MIIRFNFDMKLNFEIYSFIFILNAYMYSREAAKGGDKRQLFEIKIKPILSQMFRIFAIL